MNNNMEMRELIPIDNPVVKDIKRLLKTTNYYIAIFETELSEIINKISEDKAINEDCIAWVDIERLKSVIMNLNKFSGYVSAINEGYDFDCDSHYKK